MKKCVLTVVLMYALDCQAQFDHLQTQYIFNPFVINPAVAGEQGCMSSTISYRRQWVGFDGAPETFAFTTDSPIRNRHHNVGAVALCDKIGVISQSAYRLAYTYRVVAGDYYFSAGFAPQLILLRSGWNEVTTNQQDAIYASAQMESHFGVAFGVYFHSPHFFAGVSGQGSNKENSAFGLRGQPFHLYTGVKFGNRERLHFTVSTLARYLAPAYLQMDGNLNVVFRNRIGTGVSYRWNESVAGLLSMKLNEQLTLGYSYDFNISKLARYSSGSHEVMLRYEFRYSVHANSPR